MHMSSTQGTVPSGSLVSNKGLHKVEAKRFWYIIEFLLLSCLVFEFSVQDCQRKCMTPCCSCDL